MILLPWEADGQEPGWMETSVTEDFPSSDFVELDGGDILVAAQDLYRSTDHGVTWTEIPGILGGTFLFTNMKGTVESGLSDRVYRSTDNGETWNLSQYFWCNIVKDYGDQIFQGAIRSTETETALIVGRRWRDIERWNGWFPLIARKIRNGLGWYDVFTLERDSLRTALSVTALHNGGFLVGTDYDWALRSTDDGITWTTSSEGFPPLPLVVHSMESTYRDVAFAGTDFHGVFRSTDIGVSWQEVNEGLTGLDVTSIAVNNLGHVFVGTANGSLFRTTDEGDSWHPYGQPIDSISVDPLFVDSHGFIYTGADSGRIYRTLTSCTPLAPSVPGIGIVARINEHRTDSLLIRNMDASTHLLSSVSSTSPFFDVTPTFATIAPGESVQFTIGFVASNVDSIKADMVVESSVAGSPIMIPLRGISVAPALGPGPHHISFGQVLVGHSLEDSIMITNVGTDTLWSTAIKTTNAAFQPVNEFHQLTPGDSAFISVVFSPDEESDFTGGLFMESNTPTSPDTIKLDGRGIYEARVTLEIDEINFGSLPIGISADRTFDITNSGNFSLSVTSIRTTDSAFVVSSASFPEILPLGNVTDTLSFTATDSLFRSEHLLIESTSPSSPDTVRIIGKGDNTTLRIDTEMIVLDDVPIGAPRDTVVKLVTNTFGGILNIINVTSSNPEFVINPETGLLENDESFIDTITFTPAAGGQSSSSIVIISNARSSPDTITVVGLAIFPGGIRPLEGLPDHYYLAQNYPNPFNPSTTIRFGLTVQSQTALRIYNILGELVEEPFNAFLNAGHFEYEWNPNGIAGGTYFFRIEADNYVETKKMLYIR